MEWNSLPSKSVNVKGLKSSNNKIDKLWNNEEMYGIFSFSQISCMIVVPKEKI